MKERVWRLILDGPADGEWNMAADAALLAARERGESLPTLRLYRWSGPTVSLGRFQPVGQVDTALCAERGIRVVRRPTGGRGVLHDDELTYSVAASVDDGVPRGTAASYRYLCSALAEAYRVLGVQAQLIARASGDRGAGACYLHATQADLSLAGAKLSGSAQVWRGGSVLQHGSFVVSRDHALEAAVFRLPGVEAGDRLRAATATIEEATGGRPAFEQVAEAVVSAFASTLGVRFSEAGMTDGEREDASRESLAYRVDGAAEGLSG